MSEVSDAIRGPEQRKHPSLSADAVVDLGGTAILVLDDEPSNVTLLSMMLKRYGADQVYPVGDPGTIAEVIEAVHPDLVLLDLHMPALDGFDVLALMQQASVHPPCVVLTADDTATARERALQLGATAVLVKPFSACDLLSVLQKLELVTRPVATLPSWTQRPAVKV